MTFFVLLNFKRSASKRRKIPSKRIVIELYLIKNKFPFISPKNLIVKNSVDIFIIRVPINVPKKPIISLFVVQLSNKLYFLIYPPIKYNNVNQIKL